MSKPVPLPKAERGVIRVFSVSRPMPDMARALGQRSKAAIAGDLLAHPVTDTQIELFALSDLADVGLAGYLAEGYDIDAQALSADRARLDGLDGYVLLLFSGVSDAGAVTLHPSADLTLIGTYSEPRARHAAAPIAAQTAKPYSGTNTTPDAPRRGRAGSILSVAALLLILLLIWWIV